MSEQKPNEQTPPEEKTEEQRQEEARAVAAAHRAKSDQGDAPPPDAIVPDAPVKPEGVPDKFWNAESGEVDYAAWSKAHNELESKFHEKKDDKTEGESDETPPAKSAVVAAREEFAEKGALSEETYKRLAEESGLDREAVDGYIDGAKARGQYLEAKAHIVTGGEENYQAMLEWAGENLTEEEANAFNAAVTRPDAESVKGAVAGLFKKFSENRTVEGDALGGGIPDANSTMFNSKSEMTAAMNKPDPNAPGKTLYQNDSAYRAEVQKKIQNARRAGKNIFM